MKTLVLSDIHANLPAFESVLREAGPCDRVVFLGDIANFGAYPAECVELLKELNAICIMGNHDEQIISQNPKNDWDGWAKNKLNEENQKFIKSFLNSIILDNHILLIHGIYSVPYDILPNTPDKYIKEAFSSVLTPEIDEVWFGHYHYEIDRLIDGITYRCIRPVGHHRDKDTRAGYSIYQDGVMTHHRVKYDLEKTIEGLRNVDCYPESNIMEDFIEFTRCAYHEELLKEDIEQMRINEKL